MSSELNQLKEQIKERIDKEEFSTLIKTLATQANVALERSITQSLNSFDYTLLKLMMTD